MIALCQDRPYNSWTFKLDPTCNIRIYSSRPIYGQTSQNMMRLDNTCKTGKQKTGHKSNEYAIFYEKVVVGFNTF
jgi:hypothetical protein